MNKTIEQLISLSRNPYYKFTPEEQVELNLFLARKSELQNLPRNNGNSSEKNIPATVINKNIVKKETGKIPTVDNIVTEDDKNKPVARSKKR